MAEFIHAEPLCGPGDQSLVRPGSSCLRLLGLSLLTLTEDAPEHVLRTQGQDLVVAVLQGLCTINIEAGTRSATFPEIGRRANVFAGLPTMAYAPCGSAVRVFAESSECQLALITAPARRECAPVLVYPEEAETRTAGHGNWRVTVATCIGAAAGTESLRVGETICPPGNWCGAPPARYDRAGEDSVSCEAVYLCRFNPPQGFALARAYTAPEEPNSFDRAFTLHDGDVIAISRGYLTMAVAPGYQMHVLWALAGEGCRERAGRPDPAHAWILGAQGPGAAAG